VCASAETLVQAAAGPETMGMANVKGAGRDGNVRDAVGTKKGHLTPEQSCAVQ